MVKSIVHQKDSREGALIAYMTNQFLWTDLFLDHCGENQLNWLDILSSHCSFDIPVKIPFCVTFCHDIIIALKLCFGIFSIRYLSAIIDRNINYGSFLVECNFTYQCYFSRLHFMYTTIENVCSNMLNVTMWPSIHQ